MRTTLSYITPLLAAGAGALAIAVAPMAAAAPTPPSDPGPVQTACSSVGPGTECQTPGNVQFYDSAPQDFMPQYPMFALGYGGYGGGYGHGFGGGHR